MSPQPVGPHWVGTSVRSGACSAASQTCTPQDVPTGLGYTVLHNVLIKWSCSEIPWFNLTLCEIWGGGGGEEGGGATKPPKILAYTSQEHHGWMHVFQRVSDRIIKSLRHSVLVKTLYFDLPREWQRERERTRKGKKGKRVRDCQENWNKKKRLKNLWTGKNNYCTSGLHLVNMLWHLVSFGLWVQRTSLSLHGS